MSLLLLLGSLFLLLLLGVPVAYALGLSSLAYFVCVRPELTIVIPQRLFAGMDSYALIALPLFILMGTTDERQRYHRPLDQFLFAVRGAPAWWTWLGERGGKHVVRGHIGIVCIRHGVHRSGADTGDAAARLSPDLRRRYHRCLVDDGDDHPAKYPHRDLRSNGTGVGAQAFFWGD